MSSTKDDAGEARSLVAERLAQLRERIREKMLREGAALTDERTERAAGEALRRMLAEPPRRAFPRRALWWTLTATGVAAAALLFFLSRRESVPDAKRIPLGSGGVHLVQPLGEVRDFDRFEWVAELPVGGWYVLVLRDRSRPDASPREIRLEEPRWVPERAEREALPAELEWEVQVRDRLGAVRDSSSEAATRSKP